MEWFQPQECKWARQNNMLISKYINPMNSLARIVKAITIKYKNCIGHRCKITEFLESQVNFLIVSFIVINQVLNAANDH